MNRKVSGKSAGPRQLRALRAKLGALLRRNFARGETGEARRASIVEASEDAITSATLEGVIVSWNPGAERMYGYTAEEAVGRTVWELMSPLGGSDIVAENVARMKRGERLAPFEAVHHHRSGRRLHVSVRLAPVKDAAGEVVGVSAINRDVTEREEAGERLRESEERYRAVMEQGVEAIYLYDARTGRVLESNPAFQEMMGYGAQELCGMEIYGFIAHSREEVDRRVRRTLAERRRHTGERNYRRKDGAVVVIEASASVISYRGKDAICVVSRDVTELKRAREALEESEKRHRRQTMELTLLHRVRTALARELDLPDVFRTVVEAVANTYGYTLVSAYLLEGEELVLQHQVGYERVIERVPLDHGVMGRVARTGGPVLLEEVRSDPAFLGAIEGIVSEVCVPLFDEGRVVGTLNVESTSGMELTEDDLRLMGALAEHVGMAVSRAKLHTRVRESEERFRSLIRNAPDVITILNADNTVRYDSPAVERVLGYRPDERIGKKGSGYVHPDDLEKLRKAFDEVLGRPGDTLSLEYRIRHAGGSWRHVETTRTNLLDDPAVRGVVVNYRDVTERKEAERALKDSEERFRSLVQNASDIITLVEADGKVRYVSPAIERVLGYPPEERVGKSTFDLVHPDDAERAKGLFARSLQSPRVVLSFEMRMHHRDGSWRHVETTSANLLDDPGVDAIVLNSRDVTGRKEAEKALREAEARYRTLVEQIPAVTYVQEIERGDTALYVSPQVEALTGYSPEDYYSDPDLWYGVVHPDDLVRVRAEDERTDGTGEPFRMEYRMCHKDDRVAWVLDEAVLIEDREGRPRFWQGVLFDITERKRAEQKILFQARLLDTVGQAAVAVDLDGRITYWNRFAETLYGWSAREVVGRPASEILTPEDQQGREDEVMSELRAGRSWTGEFEVRRRDGASFTAMVTDTPVYDEQGNLAGMIGVSADITQRKEAEDALRRSKARFQAVFENAAVGMALVDMEGRLTTSNPALQEMLGYGDEEFRSMTWVELTHPDDVDLDRSHFERLVAGELDRYHIEKRYVRKDGRVIWGRLTGSVIRGAEGEPRLMVGMVEDVTERRGAEEALRESHDLLQAVMEGTTDAVFVKDLRGRYLMVNSACARFLGRPAEEIIGKDDTELFSPEDGRKVMEDDRDIMATGTLRTSEDTKTAENVTRTYLAMKGPYRDHEGEIVGVFGVSRDITERKELEERLVHQAFHDPLTELPNRALFMDRLRQALARMSRRGLPVTVLFLDLDNFKTVNDSLGHEAGDRLLVAVAGRLRECVRPEDTLARLGGDEFAVLVEGAPGLENAERVTRRILERLRAPFNIGGREVFTSANVGIAPAAATQRDPGKLLRNADLAMYGSKQRGKGGYKVFEAGEDDAVLTRLELGGDLRRALERGEFEIYYQPEVSVETGRIESLEALVRWNHPRRGILEPGDFLPVAEEVGLILAIEERVLLEVCRQGRAWQDRRTGHPPLRVCTNVSGTLFSQSDLMERVAAVLRETGLEAQDLSLEMTERVLADGSEATVAKLEALKELGVRVVIENFGTAYSALAVLRRFPLNILKLDRSLVAQIEEDPENAAIVEATINLAHALGWAVSAHGVETAGQLALLRKMGADLAQGYYFSRPITAEEANALLEQDQRRHGPGGVV